MENRYELRYILTTANGNKLEKAVRFTGEEKRAMYINRVRNAGYQFVACQKLYPFSMAKNQHNFMLISNVCANRMHAMEMGEEKYDNAEYIRLEDLKHKADEFFCEELPIAWVPYDKLSEMRQLAQMAVNHRISACEAAGRPDLVQYC